MKVSIGDYVVEISARSVYRAKGDKETTMFLLNEIGLAYREASERNIELHCYATADSMEKKANEIYSFLDSKGFYADVRA